MKVDQKHIARLLAFLDRIKSETYPEPPSPVHSQVTAQMLERAHNTGLLPPGARVLDVGCGQGVALRLFTDRGCRPVGIALNEVDVAACRREGFEAYEMDQSFLDFEDECFDFIWCRHCLEHSILPFYTLHELKRVLRPGGYAYFEMPAPDTSTQHQANKNHYSVLGKSMWLELLSRTGFILQDQMDINFTTGSGPDTYWVFLVQKP